MNKSTDSEKNWYAGGVHSVMVDIIGNEHSNMNLNPEQDCLHFT